MARNGPFAPPPKPPLAPPADAAAAATIGGEREISKIQIQVKTKVHSLLIIAL